MSCVAGRFIIYLVKTSKLATTFSFANLDDVFANLESARRDLSFGTLFVHQGLLVTALHGGPPLLGDPDLSSTLLALGWARHGRWCHDLAPSGARCAKAAIAFQPYICNVNDQMTRETSRVRCV